MKLFALLFFLVIRSAGAEENFKVYVNTFDNDIDTSRIESPVIQTTKGSGKYVSEVAKLPDPEEMLKIFHHAALNEEVKDLSQMDRDLLYMKVAKRDIASVKQSYHKIPGEKLVKLKKLIEAHK